MMGEQSESESRRTERRKQKSEFEFCKACNINHNQGLRHKYFPNHKKSLSTFLSRFRNKLSDVRFFLNAPIPLTPQLASRNRFWCVFCDQDINELSSSFACANAIRHLASADHVKNLKHFFWKYGGAVDQLDAFMVSDDDVAKWEKRCLARNDEAVLPSAGRRRTVFGPSSDIHNQLDNGNIDSFQNVYSHSVKSNAVLPLQCYTNEYQVSCSGLSGVGNTGLLEIDTTSLASEECYGANPLALQDFAVERRSHSLLHEGRQCSTDGYSSNKQVRDNGRIVSRESSHQGLQMLTQITSVPTESAGGNVHSGAPPPWLEAIEGIEIHCKPVLGSLVSHSNNSGKSKKLNPKRVGAAWAEKRKIEMEMEKRGEIVRNECDANWLPNFGRVWQSGSRRESRKEFEREKKKLNAETQSEMPIKIQPYVSKRMRMDSGDDYSNG
ncbi:TITAN-like protein isoform X1 [Abrus precatorius]|uniref:TITAN-like protein isoform X1 n=1 Tax=Abrus precatorius TaxID=3816 RepID=A0A8B8JUN8_ABRPR|nr:TITAN-like protein isoform X1 [Abrus precatorius]